MCTVSFVPNANNDFYLVSNRDEAPARETFAPKIFRQGQVETLFPQDAVAGGSWIGLSSLSRVVCLLNGGFKPHDPFANWGKSRGLIVRDLLNAKDALGYINNTSFNAVEPFTIVLITWHDSLKVHEFVWDGNQKHLMHVANKPTIWSSRQLYTPTIIKKREQWFRDFLKQQEAVNLDALLKFHNTAGEGDPLSNLIMDKGFVKTKSISAVNKELSKLEFLYQEVPEGMLTRTQL